jgi:hypothetical protein
MDNTTTDTTYDISKVADWMVKEGYFIIHKNKYLVSEKFNREVRGVSEGLVKLPNRKITVKEKGRVPAGLTPDEWRDTYMKFIAEAKVPKFGRMGDGRLYELNKFSEKAFAKFRTLIEHDAIDLERLQAVTAAYYADNRTVKVTVSNFILEGLWRTNYINLEPPEAEYEQFEIG